MPSFTRRRAHLVASIALLTGCPAEVTLEPEGGSGDGGAGGDTSNAGGAAPLDIPGCSALVQVGQPLGLPVSWAQMARIDETRVGIYYASATRVLEPFDAWPPTLSQPIERAVGPSDSVPIQARADGALASGAVVYSFWGPEEHLAPPGLMNGGLAQVTLDPTSEGAVWPSNGDLQVYGSLTDDEPSAILEGDGYHFVTTDHDGHAVFGASDPSLFFRLVGGAFQPFSVSAITPDLDPSEKAALLPWERGLFRVRRSEEGIVVEGLAETGDPLELRSELPGIRNASHAELTGFRGGVAVAFIPPESNHLTFAWSDGNLLSTQKIPLSQPVWNEAVGVVASSDERSLLVETTRPDGPGAYTIELRRFDCAADAL